MPTIHPNEERLWARANDLLARMSSKSDRLALCIVGLADDVTANPYKVLQDAGLPFSAGARNSQILEVIAEREGIEKIDREVRDYIYPRLRELS